MILTALDPKIGLQSVLIMLLISGIVTTKEMRRLFAKEEMVIKINGISCILTIILLLISPLC